jgi:selenocysteine-specific elongation factor
VLAGSPVMVDEGEAPDALVPVLCVFVREAGLAGLPRGDLVARIGLSSARADAVAGRACAAGEVVAIGDLLVDAGLLRDRAERVVASVGDYHRAEPLSDGMPREELRERLFGRAAVAVFDGVLERLHAAGLVIGRDRIALATHRVTLSAKETEIHDRLDALYRQAGLRPPDLVSLAGQLGVAPADLDQALRLLQRRKRLIKLDVLWFHTTALEALKDAVRALKPAGSEARVDVAAFKDRFGVSRKFAIPLLEYLDRERVTRRLGDTRVVL